MLSSFDDNIANVQSMIAQRAAAQQAAMASSSNDDSVFNNLLQRVQSDRAALGQSQQGSQAPPMGAVARRIGAPAPAAPAPQAQTGPAPTGNLKQWIEQALGTLHLDNSYESGLNNLIQHESGGNPNAINNWDSNAKAGHPSQGLMQTIPGTFNEYALPGHNRILNPVDNIIAGTRYALKNYGAGMIKAGGRHDARGNYIGY